jgi:DNA-binding XRE family transcriptional regulator
MVANPSSAHIQLIKTYWALVESGFWHRGLRCFAFKVVDYIPWIDSRAKFNIGRVTDPDYKIIRTRFAAELKAARLQAKMSQEALALAADVDRTYVSQLERGKANPSLLILFRLATVLGFQLDVSLRPKSSQIE